MLRQYADTDDLTADIWNSTNVGSSGCEHGQTRDVELVRRDQPFVGKWSLLGFGWYLFHNCNQIYLHQSKPEAIRCI